MTGSTREITLDNAAQGAYHIARSWVYEHPDREIPDREARVIARELIRLVKMIGAPGDEA